MTKDCSAQHYWRPRTKSVAGGGGGSARGRS